MRQLGRLIDQLNAFISKYLLKRELFFYLRKLKVFCFCGGTETLFKIFCASLKKKKQLYVYSYFQSESSNEVIYAAIGKVY